jgi:uncharacterized protein with PIN domain
VDAPRFLADAMVARLARWLRVLGYDTVWEPTLDDHALVALAAAEDRVLLTRDRHLLRELRPARALEIRSDVPLEQLRAVVDALALGAPGELFTRCLVCNTPLHGVDADEAAHLVPPDSRGLPGPVRHCPGCGRVYWHGSHVRRMRAALARAMPEWHGARSSHG